MSSKHFVLARLAHSALVEFPKRLFVLERVKLNLGIAQRANFVSDAFLAINAKDGGDGGINGGRFTGGNWCPSFHGFLTFYI